MKMDSKNIGSLIKEKRLKEGLKQFEFAKTIGISRSYLSDIENNRYLPSTKLFFKINNELKLFILINKDGNTIQK